MWELKFAAHDEGSKEIILVKLMLSIEENSCFCFYNQSLYLDQGVMHVLPHFMLP